MAVGVLAGAPPVAAAGPSITLSPSTGPPGTSVIVAGTGFCASGCSPVSIDVNGVPVAQGITVSSAGTFQASVTMAGGIGSGSLSVQATEQRSGSPSDTVQALSFFAVTPDVAAPGPSTPTTPPAVTTVPPRTAPTPTTTTITTTTKSPEAGRPSPSSGHHTSTTVASAAPADADSDRPDSARSGWSALTIALVCLAVAAGLALAGLSYRWLRTRRG